MKPKFAIDNYSIDEAFYDIAFKVVILCKHKERLAMSVTCKIWKNEFNTNSQFNNLKRTSSVRCKIFPNKDCF